jgi:hypothetical protein
MLHRRHHHQLVLELAPRPVSERLRVRPVSERLRVLPQERGQVQVLQPAPGAEPQELLPEPHQFAQLLLRIPLR